MWTTRRRKHCISPVCQWIMVQVLTVILNPVYKHCFSVVILDCFLRAHSVAATPMSEDILNYTSSLLDHLLAEKNYNRQLRPVFEDKPTIVTTDIEIRSFGPISESEMTYSMDCYFRQTWIDHRLRFEGARLDVLSMNWKFLQKVWIPDTYFMNGKSSYLHKVTVPNKFIRLRSDGQLKYSMRLTIKADCKMHLRKYPLDTQACALNIGSFAYPVHEVSYNWKPGRPVVISNDVTLSQYDFVNIIISNSTVPRREGERRSMISVHFVLQRRRGYFILQIYAPCTLIVGASWVSFWINRSDAAARVAVGATTVLTLVTMGFGGRGSLQKAAYATALDWFVIMCFTFVFAALVEYAVVNFIDNREKQQLKEHLEKEREKKKKDEFPEGQTEALQSVQTSAAPLEAVTTATKDTDDQESRISRSFSQTQPQARRVGSHPTRLGGLRLQRSRRRYTKGPAPTEKEGFKTRQIAGLVDRYARATFPLTFLILNILYWTLYLHTIDDELELDIRPEDNTL